MRTRGTKLAKVNLTGNRTETVEVPARMSVESWLKVTMQNDRKVVVLNGTSYPKEAVTGIEDVTPLSRQSRD